MLRVSEVGIHWARSLVGKVDKYDLPFAQPSFVFRSSSYLCNLINMIELLETLIYITMVNSFFARVWPVLHRLERASEAPIVLYIYMFIHRWCFTVIFRLHDTLRGKFRFHILSQMTGCPNQAKKKRHSIIVTLDPTYEQTFPSMALRLSVEWKSKSIWIRYKKDKLPFYQQWLWIQAQKRRRSYSPGSAAVNGNMRRIPSHLTSPNPKKRFDLISRSELYFITSPSPLPVPYFR